MSAPAEAVVSDVPGASRYELRVDGELRGFAVYLRRDGRLVFTHTEIDDAWEGRGYGTKLVLAVLDDARRRGLTVVPLCPFVAYQIERHPEYQHLVAESRRDA